MCPLFANFHTSTKNTKLQEVIISNTRLLYYMLTMQSLKSPKLKVYKVAKFRSRKIQGFRSSTPLLKRSVLGCQTALLLTNKLTTHEKTT